MYSKKSYTCMCVFATERGNIQNVILAVTGWLSYSKYVCEGNVKIVEVWYYNYCLNKIV